MNEDKSHMAILNESPPFMPIGFREREIWAILLELCPELKNLKIVGYEACKSITIAGLYEGEPVEKKVDISWAFKNESFGVALDLVRKVFKEINEGKV